MKAVILCGGMGTRIRDANELLPKPLLPIGNRPVVWHIMKVLSCQGINEFVLCLGYKGWLIKEFFLNYRSMACDVAVTLGEPQHVEFLGRHDEENWRVILAETGEDTMTGARFNAIRRYVEPDGLCLLTYGDGLADINLANLLRFHRQEGRVATVTAVRPPGRFGEIRRIGNVVREFNEKPQTTEGFVNGGFYLFDTRRIWDYLSDDPELVLEREPMTRLTRDRQLAAYSHEGFWQPMDTLREFNTLNAMWAEGRAPWKLWTDSNREDFHATTAGRV
jgi:glucose-1-phosphate cytidylyltransferase